MSHTVFIDCLFICIVCALENVPWSQQSPQIKRDLHCKKNATLLWHFSKDFGRQFTVTIFWGRGGISPFLILLAPKSIPWESYFSPGDYLCIEAWAVWRDGFHFTVHTLNVINTVSPTLVEEGEKLSFSPIFFGWRNGVRDGRRTEDPQAWLEVVNQHSQKIKRNGFLEPDKLSSRARNSKAWMRWTDLLF